MGDHESWRGDAVAAGDQAVRDNFSSGNGVRRVTARGGEVSCPMSALYFRFLLVIFLCSAFCSAV